MLTQQRHKIILNELQKRSSITVLELVDLLETSESTIRRDLVELDQQGKLHRVHGGATLIHKESSSIEPSIFERQVLHQDEKTSIAMYAADLIEDNDFVYIDAGSTTEKLIDCLTNEKHVTYVTNGLVQAQKLMAKGCRVQMIGGEVRTITGAVCGAHAMEMIQKCNFTKGFFGTNGADVQSGFTTPDMEEAMMKDVALHQCHMAYVLCDDTKLNKVTPVKFADINEAIIITTTCPYEEIKHNATVVEVAKK